MTAQKLGGDLLGEVADQYDPSLETARAKVIQAWVRERFQATTDNELMELLRMINPAQQGMLKEAIHATIQEQQFNLGSTTYHASFFALPVTVTFEEEPNRDTFDLRPMLPAAVQALRSSGLFDPKAGMGAALMTRLVPHSRLRALPYAKMFALAKELFYSSLAMHSPPRVATLKTDGSPMTFEISGRYAFSGYVIGCFYRKRKPVAHDVTAQQAFAKRIGELLQTQFLDPMRPTMLQVGRLVSLYNAFEEGSVLNARMLAATMVRCWDDSVSTIGIGIEAVPNDPYSSRVSLRLRDEIGNVLTEGAVDLNVLEIGALQRVVYGIEQACLDASQEVRIEVERTRSLH